jgi:GT2 family glycosyltransferase
MIRYQKPAGVTQQILHRRPVLTTAQDGRVAVDEKLLAVWQAADENSLSQVLEALQEPNSPPQAVRAALACLAEAGLLQRSGSPASTISTPASQGPLVSAIVIALNSRGWLEECLPALAGQTYQPLEIILVDNGSSDGTAEWVRQKFPQIVLLRSEKKLSFAQANNRGIASAHGTYFFLLNADARPEKDAVARLVEVLEPRADCAAAVAKLKFWWAPAFLNGFGNYVGSFSWGTDIGLGHLDLGQFDAWQDLPSACFAAALIRRSAWEQVGPLDEGFPMYYEDGEWSYRARLLGFHILGAPRAIVLHAFGGRVPGQAENALTPAKLQNVVYGRLRFAAKILGPTLGRFLLRYSIEDLARSFFYLLVGRFALLAAQLRGWQQFLRDLPALWQIRKQLQQQRLCSDEQLFAAQRSVPPAHIWHGLPELTWDLVLNAYLPIITAQMTHPIPEFESSGTKPRLLIISNDVIDVKMAGPGMRYLEIGRALAAKVQVTIAIPNATQLQVPEIQWTPYRLEQPEPLRQNIGQFDIIMISSFILEKFPFITQAAPRLVIDLYDPFVLENLHYYLKEPLEVQQNLNVHGVEITNRLAQAGDFFICGNERQRDYWLGVLTVNGRTNPLNFQRDPTLRTLIDVVGIGLPEREPVRRPILRDVHAEIPTDAQIVLWGGGIWDWLDPLTLIRAWPQVLARHSQARLVFLGTRHPNPLVPRHAMASDAERLATEIDPYGRTILFIEWLSYEDREALLCEANVGVTLHPVSVETRYSIRTRVFDYFWARLPVLITEGDITSEWVAAYQVGEVVPPSSVDAVAQALCRLLDQPKSTWFSAYEPIHERFRWGKVIEPLEHYCLAGYPAADRTIHHQRGAQIAQVNSWGWRIARARYILRQEGPGVLLHRVWRYLQWRLSLPFGGKS